MTDEVKTRKMICGIPHVQKRCEWCRLMVWVPVRGKFSVCGTCLDTKFGHDTGGGRQVIRKQLAE